jgi:hypothetical protein
MKLRLELEPATLEGPGDVVLRWRAEGATAVLLSDVGEVEPSGSDTVSVRETTTFVLTAFDHARGRVVCTQKTVSVGERVQRGIIVPWWGEEGAVPSGWIICDGREGTPDLSGRFIRGAGATGAGSRGEGGRHAHTVAARSLDGVTDDADEHEHRVEGFEPRRWRGKDGGRPSIAPVGDDRWTGGGHVHDVVVEVPETATSDAADPLPPWRALYYLMKR